MDIQEGSYGGRLGKDGLDAVDTLYANTRNNPIEDIESHYPLRVTPLRAERRARGGAGRWRGGLGTIREIEFLDRRRAARSRATARVHPPPGLFGGERRNARRGRDQPAASRRLELPSKFPYRKAPGRRPALPDRARRAAATALPAERDPDAIREDIADGVLSRERARELYGFEE